MVLIVGITGASGVIYVIRLLEVLSSQNNVETHLIISEAAEINIRHETDWKIGEVKALADFSYDITDIGARLASGSFKTAGMIKDIIDHTVGKVLDIFGIEHNLFQRWSGVASG